MLWIFVIQNWDTGRRKTGPVSGRGPSKVNPHDKEGKKKSHKMGVEGIGKFSGFLMHERLEREKPATQDVLLW